MSNVGDVGFLVQYCLIEVCNTPALGDIELEQIRKFLCRLGGHGVTPCPKRGKQFSVLIEGQITMHHSAEANSTGRLEGDPILFKDLTLERAVASLQAGPDVFEVVCPDTAFEAVFPVIA